MLSSVIALFRPVGMTTCLRGATAAAAIGLALLSAAGPAAAQDQPTQGDLRALIYYVESGDETAVQAELRRLRGLYPSWTPPEDLSKLAATSGAPDLQPVYRMIEARNTAGARQAVQDLQAKFPEWAPPPDLLRAVTLGEAQNNFDAALAKGDFAGAVAVGQSSPTLMRCDRINNPWRLAEGQAATGDRTTAIGVFRDLVASCNDFQLVVASIEKTRAIATDDQLISVIDVARGRFPSYTTRLDALQARLTGQQAGAPAVAAATPDATATPAPVAVAPAAKATALPRPAPAASAPVEMVQAAPVVRAQPAPSREALVSPGAGTSVRGPVSRLGTLPASGDGRLAAVRAAARSDNFAACAANSARPRSLDVAYERGWCVYNLDRPLEALALFSAAAQSGKLGGEMSRDAAYGMALSYLKRSMTEEASRVAAATDFTESQRKDVESIILDQRGVRSYQLKEYRKSIAFFDGIESLTGTLRRDLAIMRAYAYLNVGNRVEARKQFEYLNSQLSTEETRDGLNAAR